ncbi:MAG: hypothetical protein AAF517_15550 [Planctomycetota bacterium]
MRHAFALAPTGFRPKAWQELSMRETGFRSRLGLEIGAVLASFFVSAWSVWSDDIINNDGILYLRCAREFSAGNWEAAFAVYGWPWYSYLISIGTSVLGLSGESAAHLLDAVCNALMVFAFISIAKWASEDRRVHLLAAFFIVAFPEFNEDRSSLLRDHGFLAFYLLSIRAFLSFESGGRWSSAALWGAFMLVAALFRIEGFALWAMVPFVVLFDRRRGFWKRMGRFAVAHSVLLLLSVAGAAVWLVYAESRAAGVAESSRLFEPFHRLADLWPSEGSGIEQRLDVLKTSLLNQYTESYAPVILVVASLTIVGLESVRTATIPIFLLLLVVIRSRPAIGVPGPRVWAGLVLANVTVLVVFVIDTLFLTERSALPLALLMLLAAPWGVVSVWGWIQSSKWAPRAKKWVQVATCIGLAVWAIEGLVSFGPTKDHIKNCGHWISENLGADVKVYSNSELLLYYAGRDAGPWDGAKSWEWTKKVLRTAVPRGYEYVAVRVRRKRADLEADVRRAYPYEPLRVFEGNRGGKVFVYRCPAKR